VENPRQFFTSHSFVQILYFVRAIGTFRVKQRAKTHKWIILLLNQKNLTQITDSILPIWITIEAI